MQYSVAVALLPFDRKAESSTTRHHHNNPPRNISLHTHLPFHHPNSQCFPWARLSSQPSLQTRLQPNTETLSSLLCFSQLFSQTETKSNSVCTHCRIMVSSTGNSFMYPQQHAQKAHCRNTQSLLPTLISQSPSQLTPLNPTQTRSSQHKSVQNQPTKLALSGQLYSQFSPQQEPSQLHAL